MAVSYIILSTALFAQTNSRETLINGKWVEPGVYRMIEHSIRFFEDGTYSVQYNGYFDYEIRGYYKLQKNRLITYPDLENGAEMMEVSPPQDLLESGNVWTLGRNQKDAIIYNTTLRSEGGMQFADVNSVNPAGLSRGTEGTRLITVAKAVTVLEHNSNIRTSPALNSPKATYSISGKEYPYLPAGREVVLLGRTAEKETVPGYDPGYWYYIEAKLYPMEESGPKYGWVYGPLLNMDKTAPFDFSAR